MTNQLVILPTMEKLVLPISPAADERKTAMIQKPINRRGLSNLRTRSNLKPQPSKPRLSQGQVGARELKGNLERAAEQMNGSGSSGGRGGRGQESQEQQEANEDSNAAFDAMDSSATSDGSSGADAPGGNDNAGFDAGNQDI